MLSEVRLREQYALLESEEMVTLPGETIKVSFMPEELHAINPTQFPYYFWHEARQEARRKI